MTLQVAGPGKEALDKEILRLQCNIKRVHTWAAEAQIASEFTEAFPESKAEVAAGIGSGVVNGIRIRMNDVETLSSCTPYVKWLCARCGKFTIEDFPEIQRRIYDFGTLKLMCFFRYDDGATCQFVKVGTEDKAIYELQCDGKKALGGANDGS